MSEPEIQIVIMAGGSGSRLWPASRSMHPKQFQALTESRTMLQVTAQRVDPLTDRRPLLICNEDHRFIAAEQMRGIDTPCEIILEPVGRNTAPAVALAALRATRDDEDALRGHARLEVRHRVGVAVACHIRAVHVIYRHAS